MRSKPAEGRATDPEVIRRCASRLIESGALGTGQTFSNLFRYLVDRTLSGRIPREFDIAVDVFGKDERFRDLPDAQIRVHMYKLRRRLEAYYASAGKDEPFRLEIPKGSYQVFAVPNTESKPATSADFRRWTVPAAFGFLLFLFLISLGTNVYFSLNRAFERSEPPPLANPLWAGIREGSRPILIIIGDLFFFHGNEPRLHIRDVWINSEQELRAVDKYQSFDVANVTYLPKSVAFALQPILPIASASGRNVVLKLSSEMTSGDLRNYDIIYVGFVRSMGIIRDYYFSRSNFSTAPPYRTLTHLSSAKSYSRSGSVRLGTRDYGIYAAFKGPTGNEIVIVTGLVDSGVLASARSMTSPEVSQQIEEMLAKPDTPTRVTSEFEVLLEVVGRNRTDFDYRVVGAYALSE